MAGVLFKKWLAECADGFVDDAALKTMQRRFLVAAARDAGGERVRVPSLTSRRTAQFRLAQRMVAMGLSLDECQAVVGDDFCRATFYRWKAKAAESDGVIDLIPGEARELLARSKGGFVYALEFEGLDAERFIKIGSSWRPRARAVAIAGQTDLILVGAAVIGVGECVGEYSTDAMALEFATHKLLDDCRVELEWFRVPGGLDQVIEAVEEASKPHFKRVLVSRI
jgi:hypothetical protein